MSGWVFLASLFESVDLGVTGVPFIVVVAALIFVIADAFYLYRLFGYRKRYSRALKSNVVKQFHRHLTGVQKHVISNRKDYHQVDSLFLSYFFDTILNHIDDTDMTTKDLAGYLQITPRQLDKASKRVTGLSAMKVYDTVKSQYIPQQY